LRPRPPFRLDYTAWALRRREQNEIDRWDGRTYRRSLVLDGVPLELAVSQTGPASRPRLELRLGGQRRTGAVENAARAILERLLGLRVDLTGFYARAAGDPILCELAARYRGLKPPRFPSVFECLLNAVACQQLSLAAGLTVLSRLAGVAGRDAGSGHAFPEPGDLLRVGRHDLRSIGFSERKVATITALAHAAGKLDTERLSRLGDETVRERLTQQPGIGPWSADYVLLRALGRLHVFPRGDVGALNGLRRLLDATDPSEQPEGALARWAPDAGLVYFHLLLRGLDERGSLAVAGI